jgi:hypothetical protein
MLRYCFTTTDPVWKPRVKTMYSHLPVEISEISKTEGCIVSKTISAKKDIEGQNGYLGSLNNYARPIPIPKWKEISVNSGPFITEERYIQTIANISHKQTNQVFDITKQMELIIYSFLTNYRDTSTYNKKFNQYMIDQLGVGLDKLDLSEFQQKTLILPSPADDDSIDTYKFVVIDGQPVELSVYTTPVSRVNSSGEIIDGILEKDVVLNYAKPSPYATIDAPGASWAYKWTSAIGTTYAKLLFNDKDTTDEDTDTDNDSIATDQSDDNQSQYGSAEEEEVNVNENEGKWVYVENEEPIIELDRLDSSILSTQELNLPLVYLKTKTDQWKIIHTCLVTNFRNRQYLSRVSDNVLNTIVNAINYSIESGNTVPNAAISILQYSLKRNGKPYKHVYETMHNPNE